MRRAGYNTQAQDRYRHHRPYPAIRKPFTFQHKLQTPLVDPFPFPFPSPSTPTPTPTSKPLPHPFALRFNSPTNAPATHRPPVNPVPPIPRNTPQSPQSPPTVSPQTPGPSLRPAPSLKMPGAYPLSLDNLLDDPTIANPDPQPTHTQPKPNVQEETEETNPNQPEDQYTRRSPPPCDIRKLKKRVQKEFGDGELSKDEEMLLKQLNALCIDYTFHVKLSKFRQTMKRASRDDKKRSQKNAQRDAYVEKVIRMEQEAREEQERRRRMDERLQKYREEVRQRQKEAEAARRKQEKEAQERECLRRMKELAEKLQRERKERERKEKEEAENRAKEEAARRMEEQFRKAREFFAPINADAIRAEFQLYDSKWAELKTSTQLPPLCFKILPWPVLGPAATSPSDITLERVEAFIFHPLRGGDAETKSRRDRVRAEMLKWHPDKFNAKVVGPVIDAEKDLVEEAAGVVARILTQILEAETKK